MELCNAVLCETGSVSKNCPMPAVKTCPLDPAALAEQFRVAALARGFREEPFGESDGVTLSAYTKRSGGSRPRIYLSAGVHGDEPAPPQALLEALNSNWFDDRATWFLVPMLNPTGFRQNERDNSAGIDLNRDYLHLQSTEVLQHTTWLRRQPRFDLALCLHEDWEATGFYLYELARRIDEEFARKIRAHVEEVLPIESGEVIDGRPVSETGIIRPESDPALREQWPEAIYLFKHHTHHCLTFESPTPQPLSSRIAAQLTAMRSAIDNTLTTD